MNQLLAEIIDAHGGFDRWNGYERVEATIVSGGGFFPLKGVPLDLRPRRMSVWLHEQRSSVSPYGAPDQRTMFTPDRIAIEKLDGKTVDERWAPRDSFAGHQMSTPWDPLHRAYFNGEALWTYLTSLCVPKTSSELMTRWNHLSWGDDRAALVRAGRPGLAIQVQVAA